MFVKEPWPACRREVISVAAINAITGPPMPTGQLIFFACWLALAMLGAVAIVFAWERLRSRSNSPAGSDPGS